MSEHGDQGATGRPADDQPAWGTPPSGPSPSTSPEGASWPSPAGPSSSPPPWGTPPESLPGQPGQPTGHPSLPRQRDGKTRSGWGKAAGAGAGAAALAGKAGLLGKMFLLFKGLTVLAKFKAFASMILSVGVYAIFWGWPYAVGLVLLLAVHELGHIAAARAQGRDVSAPMFIPLVGAYVTMKEQARSVAEDAWAALAGPIAGLLAGIVLLELAQLNGSLLLRALAYTGFLINLLNLIPVFPLDGAHVAGALHPSVWLAGIGVAAVVLLWRPSVILGFVLVLGGFETVRRWRLHRSGQVSTYQTVPPTTRAWIAAAYVAAAVVCLWGMQVAYVPRPY